MRTRKLSGSDAEDWKRLRLEALSLYPQAFLTTYAEAEAMPLATIAERLESGHTYGVLLNDALAGIGSLLPMMRAQTRHRGEIGALFVQPGAQGTGAADALMTALMSAAQDLGIWQLELYAAASNPRAIRFYTRHGFVEVGRLPNAVVTERGAETDLIMIRSTPPA